MELIETIDGKWYWLIDYPQIGFHQSITYKTKLSAILDAYYGEIQWEDKEDSDASDPS
jgi:hypothetical protein